jgi:hypothetical protein
MCGTGNRAERVRRDSWDMARKLVAEGRITFETAAWALKQSGHSREEVRRFIGEASERQARLLMGQQPLGVGD